MIAVIYARVSSNSGRQDTERQVNELSAYARNNNIEVAKVFRTTLVVLHQMCSVGYSRTA